MGNSFSLTDVNSIDAVLSTKNKLFLNNNNVINNLNFCDIIIISEKEWAIPNNSMIEVNEDFMILKDRYRINGGGILTIESSNREITPFTLHFTNDPYTGEFLCIYLMEKNESYSQMICNKLNSGFFLPYPRLSNVRFSCEVNPCPVCISLRVHTFEDSTWKVWILYNLYVNKMTLHDIIDKIIRDGSTIQSSMSRFNDYMNNNF